MIIPAQSEALCYLAGKLPSGAKAYDEVHVQRKYCTIVMTANSDLPIHKDSIIFVFDNIKTLQTLRGRYPTNAIIAIVHDAEVGLARPYARKVFTFDQSINSSMGWPQFQVNRTKLPYL